MSKGTIRSDKGGKHNSKGQGFFRDPEDEDRVFTKGDLYTMGHKNNIHYAHCATCGKDIGPHKDEDAAFNALSSHRDSHASSKSRSLS